MHSSESYDPIIPDHGAFAARIGRRLQSIYKEEFHEGWVNRILAICGKHYPSWPGWSEKEIILITYGNSIRSDGELPLQTLSGFLRERLKYTFSCVHILPFFPFTSDDGFAVSDFMKVDPALGNWEHIETLNKDFCLMADLVVNHVSSDHPWFKNFLTDQSPGRDYFIEAEEGADYSMTVRPRSTPLFTRFNTSRGEKYVWTTFSADQIDLNFANPEVLLEMIRVLIFYISRGVRFIRLDAIAYLWKRPATACLHLEETHEIVKLLREIVSFVRPGTVIITETNVPNKENWSYFGNGDEANMVYQFSLPPLLLHALFSENTEFLTSWANQIPQTPNDQTFLNYTASHDGIGVRPLEGLVPEREISRLIDGMNAFGGLVSMKTNRNGTSSPYEINITYYDAMKGTHRGVDRLNESRFICSQTIMMSLTGIPAFYIHSLLATHNDHKGVENTGRARSINRSVLDLKQLDTSLSADTDRQRIYNELNRIISIRKQCTAFHPAGKQHIMLLGNTLFAFKRNNERTGETIYCISNVSGTPVQIPPVIDKTKKGQDLLSGEHFAPADPVILKACQTRWIRELT